MRKPKPFWEHWGLRKNPFGRIENANDVFESRETLRLTDLCMEAVEEGGIYSISGERGIGKTTVRNELINYLHEHSNRYAYSVPESMDLNKLRMPAILTALVMDLSSEQPKANTEHRGRQVRRILGELAAHKKAVLFIDEAQRLRVPILESLKQLTELRWALRTRLLTVFLFGQPELDWRVSLDEGLKLRVTPYRMKGLSQDEVLQYMDQRIRASEGTMTDIFEEEALTYLAENMHSPLHINYVCSGCMRAARHIGSKKVTLGIVFESGGIRTPREILRDNGISVRKFARLSGVCDSEASKLVNGKVDEIPPEQRQRLVTNLQNITRPNGDSETEVAKAV